MKKQRIYAYLQRSLLKILIKSNQYSGYPIQLRKPLNTKVVSLTVEPNLDKLNSLLARIIWHSKQTQTFYEINRQEKITFKCQFVLINFKRPNLIFLVYSTNSLTSFNFFDASRGKLVNVKESLKNSQSLNHFYAPTKHSLLLFLKSFYKKRKEYKKSIKGFHKLYFFFSVFSFNFNNKMSFFNNVELPRKLYSVEEGWYQYTITYRNCSFPSLEFFNSIKNSIDIFDAFGKKEVKKNLLKGKPRSFFQLFYLLLIIFSILINNIKQKKEKVYKEQGLNSCFSEFNEISQILFFWFKVFFYKITVIPQTSEETQNFIFLMRPLFSLTRFDTFFICEILKLPIYPDKSNLRIDILRNRVRKQILPMMRILLNPQFDTLLCKFIK